MSRSSIVIGSPQLVPRVLEVVKNQICFIIGTVYMEMHRKPNVLIDIARDVSNGHSQIIVLWSYIASFSNLYLQFPLHPILFLLKIA